VQVLVEVVVEPAHAPVVAGIVVAETRWRGGLQEVLRSLPAGGTRPIAALALPTLKRACLPPTNPTEIRSARRSLNAALQGSRAVPLNASLGWRRTIPSDESRSAPEDTCGVAVDLDQ
jgi:hypothetical protein